jgi:hypothetical protein
VLSTSCQPRVLSAHQSYHAYWSPAPAPKSCGRCLLERYHTLHSLLECGPPVSTPLHTSSHAESSFALAFCLLQVFAGALPHSVQPPRAPAELRMLSALTTLHAQAPAVLALSCCRCFLWSATTHSNLPAVSRACFKHSPSSHASFTLIAVAAGVYWSATPHCTASQSCCTAAQPAARPAPATAASNIYLLPVSCIQHHRQHPP